MTALRAARSTDAGAVGAILTAFAAETSWLPKLHTGAEDLAHAGVMIDRGWVTVAEGATGVLGFSALNGADLDALYVFSAAQGQGVGTALLEQAQQEAHRLELWTFQANTRAQAFYIRHGFDEVARSDGAGNDEGLPDIKLVWTRKGTT